MKEKAWMAIAVVIAMSLGVIALEMMHKRPATIEVSVFEVMEHIKNAEDKAKKVDTLENVMTREFVRLNQQVNDVAMNHNRLVQQTANDINASRLYIRLLERALVRLNGRPDWTAAMAGAKAEIEEEGRLAKQPAIDVVEPVETKEPVAEPEQPAEEEQSETD